MAKTMGMFSKLPAGDLAKFVTAQASVAAAMSPEQLAHLGVGSPDLHELIMHQRHIIDHLPVDGPHERGYLQTLAPHPYLKKKHEHRAPPPATPLPARATDFLEGDGKKPAAKFRRPKMQRLHVPWQKITKQWYQSKQSATSYMHPQCPSMKVQKSKKHLHQLSAGDQGLGIKEKITYQCKLPSGSFGDCRTLLTVMPGGSCLQFCISDGCQCTNAPSPSRGLDPAVEGIAAKLINRVGAAAQPKQIALATIQAITGSGPTASPSAELPGLGDLAGNWCKRKKIMEQVRTCCKKQKQKNISDGGDHRIQHVMGGGVQHGAGRMQGSPTVGVFS